MFRIIVRSFPLIAAAIALSASLVHMNSAQSAERSCKYVRQLNQELNCGLVERDDDDQSTHSLDSKSGKEAGNDFLMNHTFGPTDCKIAATAKNEQRDLQTDCNKWRLSKKAELKDRYQAGTCADECEPCSVGGISGQACSVQGVVHYIKSK